MGNFKVVIEAVGNHGCQREVGNGGQLAETCGNPGCTDCMTRHFVRALKQGGNSVSVATVTHWLAPDGTPQASTVLDDLLTGIRHGNFNLKPGESNVGPVLDWDKPEV